jgi:hypothetical protein
MADPRPPENEIGSAAGDAGTRYHGLGFGGPASWSQWGGAEDIERVVELMWPNSIRAYSAMMNDAQIASLLHGLTLPIRAYWWYIDPNGAPPEAVERVKKDYNLSTDPEPTDEFKRRRSAKRFSFEKHLEDALRALVYGHYFFEQVGQVGEDGYWHLQKLGIRPPRTVTEINVAPDGGLMNIVQGYRYPNPIIIPINRLVAYVWDREGANWTGRSMLRPVYRNHIVKDRVLRVGAINIERAGGVPFVQAPEGASGDQIRELDLLARKFRVGEGAGAALPHGAQLKFASAANGDGAVAYIKQQNEEMARAFLQMVNMLGQTNSGSRALGDTFHDILRIAQYTIAKWFCDIFNEHVLEDDIEFNEGPLAEYAPQLKFNAGRQDPMMGFHEKLEEMDEDPEGEGLDAPDDVRAALGQPRRRPLSRATAMRRDASRRDSGKAKGSRVSASTDEASPVMLPPRELRRQPYEQEIQAAVDFSAIDSTYEGARLQIENEIQIARSFMIDELTAGIAAAADSPSAVAAVTTTVSAADRLFAHLQTVAMIAMDQAVQEAQRQGVDIPRQSVADLEASLRSRAEALDVLIREDITQSARREAVRLTGGSLSAAEVAEEGRKLVFTRDGRDGTLFASELLDSNTCGPCIAIDGTSYESVSEAERDYPSGHFKDCDGRERCRGMVIKVYAKVPAPNEVPA